MSNNTTRPGRNDLLSRTHGLARSTAIQMRQLAVIGSGADSITASAARPLLAAVRAGSGTYTRRLLNALAVALIQDAAASPAKSRALEDTVAVERARVHLLAAAEHAAALRDELLRAEQALVDAN